MSTAQLHAEIEAVCPIQGVSIGKVDDKKTWKVHYADLATQEQKDAAQAVINAFDWAAAEAEAEEEAKIKQEAMLKAAKDLAVTKGKTAIATKIQGEIDALEA